MERREGQKDLLIAVMGATGTGKSTFVNVVSGTKFSVGDGLRSCTSDVAYSQMFEVSGRRVFLIDTPGFDDTSKSDTDILKMIATHLSTTYEAGAKLSGIIYMHRISDNRMGGISRRNFNMFRKLCGDETLQNVLIVTTMWSEVDAVVGEKREKELMSDDLLFKPVLDKGAKMVRHDNTSPSAQAILKRMIRNHPEPLRIQRELVDKKMDITETGAGTELDKELAATVKKLKNQLADVRREMAEALAAKDRETKEELDAARKDLDKRLKQVEWDRDRLSREYMEEQKRAAEELQSLRQAVEAHGEDRAKRNEEFGRMQREAQENESRHEQELAELRRNLTQVQTAAPPRKGFFSHVGDALGALAHFRF